MKKWLQNVVMVGIPSWLFHRWLNRPRMVIPFVEEVLQRTQRSMTLEDLAVTTGITRALLRRVVMHPAATRIRVEKGVLGPGIVSYRYRSTAQLVSAR